jgi:hypothetical protein
MHTACARRPAGPARPRRPSGAGVPLRALLGGAASRLPMNWLPWCFSSLPVSWVRVFPTRSIYTYCISSFDPHCLT